MAQPASNPKIEELRFRLKTDPKSRLFFPLAEELRKIDQLGEAEQVLRAGLNHHPTYLSAWVSLGRVLREADKHGDAVEALNKALQLDPGNVVAARLLADSYLDLGDKVEAIKKYKLVRALLPANTELDAIVEKLEDEINPVTFLKPPPDDTLTKRPPPAPATPEPEPEPPKMVTTPGESTLPSAPPSVQMKTEEAPFATEEAVATGDAEPMRVAHEESPFEEPAAGYTAASVTVEEPIGIHVEPAPLGAETPTPWTDEEPASDVFAPAEAPPPPAAASQAAEDAANTVTMAELYTRQGHIDKARDIYNNILQRDPQNSEVREKLASLTREPASSRNPKAEKLQRWLAKVKKGEEGSVV